MRTHVERAGRQALRLGHVHRLAAKNPRVEPRLIVVPHAPAPKDLLELTGVHRLLEDLVNAIAQCGVGGRKDPDVIARAHVRRLIDQPGIAANPAPGEHIIQQHRVHAPDGEIAVGMHVVLVGHGDDPVRRLCSREQLVRER